MHPLHIRHALFNMELISLSWLDLQIIRDAIELRAKDKQKMVSVYEKFRAFRKKQDFEFGEQLRRIRDEKGKSYTSLRRK
jgi:hypothetical protein